jgi:thioredoxin reductase (NADPH)
MAESTAPIPLTASRAEQIFPTLTEAQLQRLTVHGRARSVLAGKVLVELGDKDIPVFVVISGELEAVRPSFTQETLIRIVGPGNFTGEINTLSGRRAFARLRARQGGALTLINRVNQR